MIIEQKKCDQCGRVHELVPATIEIRGVSGYAIPQIDRRDGAQMPSWELPHDHRKVVTMFIYDFCDLTCAKLWIEQRLAVPPIIKDAPQMSQADWDKFEKDANSGNAEGFTLNELLLGLGEKK